MDEYYCLSESMVRIQDSTLLKHASECLALHGNQILMVLNYRLARDLGGIIFFFIIQGWFLPIIFR